MGTDEILINNGLTGLNSRGGGVGKVRGRGVLWAKSGEIGDETEITFSLR